MNKMEEGESRNDSKTVFDQRSGESDLKRTESEISNLSFKRWHKRMQIEHEILRATPFKLWKWCNKCCLPCRWFDSIDYNKKISKCCLTFKSFKNIVTIFLVAVFLYAFMYGVLDKEVLPGGSVFFLLILFLTAYLVGYVVTLAGMPGMIGHLITGLTFGNVPHTWLPNRNEEFMEKAASLSERMLLIIALIRGGLLLDLTRMKNRFSFIFCTALFPFFFEFLVVWFTSHFLLSLEWDWSALQGSTVSIVSLATVTSIMEKNKKLGYGEDKHLSTVLIAASVINVLFGVILYFTCLNYIIYGFTSDSDERVWWIVILKTLKQSVIGIVIGLVSGLLVSFFPDKRNPEAAGLRIIVIGIGSFGITSFLNSLEMNIAGAIACLLLCFICTNIWEEIGWHQDSNPVLYFYTMAYYIAQPLVLSLLGYNMNFHQSSGKDTGLSFSVLLIGLLGREIMCLIVLQKKSYTTSSKEKIFISLAWVTKGTFQVLLAFSVWPFMERNNIDFQVINQSQLTYRVDCIKRTTILATLLLTPLACYCLTLLTPKLLTRTEEFSTEDYKAYRQKNRLSISRYKDTIAPTRKFSVKYFSEMTFFDKESHEKPKKSENEKENISDKDNKSDSEKEIRQESSKDSKNETENKNKKVSEETTKKEKKNINSKKN